MNSKVTFNTGFNSKVEDTQKVDDTFKYITVRGTDNKLTKVHAERFTDEKLDSYIQRYIQTKKDEEETTEQATSLFHTTLSSIKSARNFPREFLHNTNKDQRYLNNYEKQRERWKKNAKSLTRKVNKNSFQDSLMRRSDAFAEMQVAKSGKLVKESTYYNNMNDWYGDLRQGKDQYERRSNYIEHAVGTFPIYVHETCHFRDINIIKRPKDLDIFENQNTENPCLKHLKRSHRSMKSQKVIDRINSVGNLYIKGTNKFVSEIDYIRSIPEDNRYMVKNENEEAAEVDFDS